MKPKHYRPKRKERPKEKGKISRSKSLMLAAVQERTPITSPQLRATYSTKIEWAKKLLPKLKKEAKVTEEKEEPR